MVLLVVASLIFVLFVPAGMAVSQYTGLPPAVAFALLAAVIVASTFIITGARRRRRNSAGPRRHIR